MQEASDNEPSLSSHHAGLDRVAEGGEYLHAKSF